MSGERLVTSENSQKVSPEKIESDNRSENSLMFADEHDLLNNYGYGFYAFLTLGCIFTVLGIMLFAQSIPWCKLDCGNRFRSLLCNQHSWSFHPNTSLLLDRDLWGDESETDETCSKKGGNIEHFCVCNNDLQELNESFNSVVEIDDNRLKLIEETINVLKNQQDFIRKRMDKFEEMN